MWNMLSSKLCWYYSRSLLIKYVLHLRFYSESHIPFKETKHETQTIWNPKLYLLNNVLMWTGPDLIIQKLTRHWKESSGLMSQSVQSIKKLSPQFCLLHVTYFNSVYKLRKYVIGIYCILKTMLISYKENYLHAS